MMKIYKRYTKLEILLPKKRYLKLNILSDFLLLLLLFLLDLFNSFIVIQYEAK